ncbi:hypothetical protein J3Q64DRAFT_1724674 [Phycomyces blakesleeanus]
MDVSTLDNLLAQNQSIPLVVRLTNYGTIDSCLYRHPLESNKLTSTTITKMTTRSKRKRKRMIMVMIGTPIMRLVHTDDAARLCAGLKQASSGYTTTLDLLYPDTTTDSYQTKTQTQTQNQIENYEQQQTFEITASMCSGDLLCSLSTPRPIDENSSASTLMASLALLGHFFEVPLVSPVKGIIQRSRERVLRIPEAVIVTLQHMKSRPLIRQLWECMVWAGLIDHILLDTLVEGRPSSTLQ